MKNWRNELRCLTAFLQLPALSESAEIQGAVDEARLTFPAKALYLVLRMYASPRLGECQEQGEMDSDSMLHAALDRFSEYSIAARVERSGREAEVQALHEELSRLGYQLETLPHSRSWTLTAPLRRVYSVLRSRNQDSI